MDKMLLFICLRSVTLHLVRNRRKNSESASKCVVYHKSREGWILRHFPSFATFSQHRKYQIAVTESPSFYYEKKMHVERQRALLFDEAEGSSQVNWHDVGMEDLVSKKFGNIFGLNQEKMAKPPPPDSCSVSGSFWVRKLGANWGFWSNKRHASSLILLGSRVVDQWEASSVFTFWTFGIKKQNSSVKVAPLFKIYPSTQTPQIISNFAPNIWQQEGARCLQTAFGQRTNVVYLVKTDSQ